MFCTICANHTLHPTGHCASCGAALAGAPDRSGPAHPRLPPDRAGADSRRRFRHLLYLFPVFALLLAAAPVVEARRDRERNLGAAYALGETAMAEGRYLDAQDAFAAAAGHLDAPARRTAAAARLAPYEAAYLDGLAALQAGRHGDAIAALLPVVRDLPAFRDAASLLEQARVAREADLLAQVDIAAKTGDWWRAEQLLGDLAATDPGDAALAERLAALRRDHAPLVYARGRALYLIGPDGTGERLLSDAVPAAWPVWSPDRSRIAFVSVEASGGPGDIGLWVINGDGSGLTEILSGTGQEGPPVWSPDGRKIAFAGVGEVPGQPGQSVRSVRYVDLDSGRVTDATAHLLADAASPTWSPAGDRLAFVSRRMDASWTYDPGYPAGEVYVLTLATGEIAGVGGGRFRDARRIAWSPSGEHLLVFSRAQAVTDDYESIALLDLSTERVDLIRASTEDITTPAWSPDGRRFAYVVDGIEVRVETPGGEAHSIPINVFDGRYLTWSPDGEAVVLTGSVASESSLLVPLAAGGGPPLPLPILYDGDRRLGGPPQWSPLNPMPNAGAPAFAGTAMDGGR